MDEPKKPSFLQLCAAPFIRWFEVRDYIRPEIVATCDYDHSFPLDDEDNICETVTFYLLEYPSGRRDYAYYEYGMCEENDAHRVYMRNIMLWVYGGPLPVNAKKLSPGAAVIPLTLVKKKKTK